MTTSPASQTAGTRCAADLAALFRARNPLMWMPTREEARAERVIFEACAAAGYSPVFWDCAAGVSTFDGKSIDSTLTDPGMALEACRTSNARQVWVFRDLSRWMQDATILRAVRNLCRQLPAVKRDVARALVVLTPSSDVPPDLAGHAAVVELPLPDRAEIGALLDAAVAALPEDKQAAAAPNGKREAAIDAAIGLTAEEVQSTFARSLIATSVTGVPTIDAGAVASEKRRVISREKVLEWYDPLPGGLDAVGGLEVLKEWLLQHRAAFTADAREYGLKAPKGALLVGPPGCGKSLTAKAIATAWGMPLLRLDLGALKSKFVGESEGNIRKALKVAETVAPCVLWCDEIEKALAGATQGGADGGVSQDSLGTILNWMQERAGSVFVIATANDVSKLPPELMRKGRFDELFSIDLPTAAERAAIVRAALREWKAPGADAINVPAVATATAEFVGAEIAALVPEAMFVSFADGKRDVTTDDLLAAARRTVPLSKTAADKIAAVRAWAQGRARAASVPEVSTQGNARALDI